MKGKSFTKVLVSMLLSISMLTTLALLGCSGGDDSSEVGPAGSVTITVDITAAVDEGDPTAQAMATKYGGNTFQFKIGIDDKATALSATRASRMVVAMNGDFVDSLDGLAAGAVSEFSGWTFTINGEWALVGPGEIPVVDGDVIAWTYVTSWDM